MSDYQLPEEYKQTEIGVIPEDWEVELLGNILKLDNGFAFKSEYFSDIGLIILTPGNFRLEGGLYFNDRNIKRYSGNFPESTVFQKGDLLVVMTDLTPDCNLLGKPAFVELEESLLHNQRIGKVCLSSSNVDRKFLYFLLLSNLYLKRIKEQATGSTVRHTSNKSIYSISLPIPKRIEEQRSLAQALSDVDALIAALDKLIAKKRDLKTATMQQLLTGKKRLPGFGSEWKAKQLSDVCEIISGGTPSTSNIKFWNGNISWCTPTDITATSEKYLERTARKISAEGLSASAATLLPVGSILLCTKATIGEIKIAKFPVATNQGFNSLIPQAGTNNEFIYYLMLSQKNKLIEKGVGSTFLEISKKDVASLTFNLPSLGEQRAIALVLSDMDNAISLLESRLAKTKAIKQGMMQELLTGRTRLV